MHAAVGDTIAVPGRTVGAPGQVGQVLEVRGEQGGPPYKVRWEDGHVAVCYPGPETRVSHEGHLDLT